MMHSAVQNRRVNVDSAAGSSTMPACLAAEATLPASEPLILRFPPTGRLTVQLEGFPARTVPLLEVVGVDEAAALRPENPGATGVFEFAQVPVDLDFEARFMTVQIDDDGFFRGLDFDPGLAGDDRKCK